MGDRCNKANHGIHGLKVTRTTKVDDVLLRERHCDECGEKINTIEESTDSMNMRAEGARAEKQKVWEEIGELQIIIAAMAQVLKAENAAKGRLIEKAEELGK